MSKVLGIILARGGSKGIKNKNLLKLKKKNLIQLAIKTAQKSKLLDKIIFSSDSIKLIKTARKEIKVDYVRPKSLATDNSSSYDVARHVVHWLEKKNKDIFKYIVLLQPTTPFRTPNDIDECIKNIMKYKLNAVITVTDSDYPAHWLIKKNKFNILSKLIKTKKKIFTRQTAPKTFKPNGMVYVFERNFLLKLKGILPQKKTMGVYIDYERSINIDNYNHYLLAQILVKKYLN